MMLALLPEFQEVGEKVMYYNSLAFPIFHLAKVGESKQKDKDVLCLMTVHMHPAVKVCLHFLSLLCFLNVNTFLAS